MGIEKDSKLAEKLRKLEELLHGESGKQLWDIITCLRGPDSPSEKANDDHATRNAAYAKRRERKHETVEVIRGIVAPGIGEARFRQDISYVTLPPSSEWDHFDNHVYKAAMALGIEVKTKKAAVRVVWKEDEPKPTLSQDAYEAKLISYQTHYGGNPNQISQMSSNAVDPAKIAAEWEAFKQKLEDAFSKPSVLHTMIKEGTSHPEVLTMNAATKIAYEKLLKGDGA